MRSIVLGVAAVVCVSMPALASELVVTNNTAEYASLDLPFTDASNLLKVGEGGELVVNGGNMYIGWSNHVASAQNVNATNVFTVSGGGRFAFDNGGVASTSRSFHFGTWAAPKRRSLVTFTGAGTTVDLQYAWRSYFNGNTVVGISDGATVYLARNCGLGFSISQSAAKAYETLMTISGEDTQVFLSNPDTYNCTFSVGCLSDFYATNRVVITGGSIKPLCPNGTGATKIAIGSKVADGTSKKMSNGIFEMQGGIVDLVTANGNVGVNCCLAIGPGNGEFRMSGGQLTCGDICIGQYQEANYTGGNATHVQRFYMTGGQVNGKRLYLGPGNSAQTTSKQFQYQEAHLDLDGGILMITYTTFNDPALSGGCTHGYLTANGGTIKASSDSTVFLHNFDSAKMGPKGLTIDNNGKALTVKQSFSNKDGEDGTLIFAGAGTTTFAPALGCTVSKTIVKGGTLTTSTNSVWETTLVITNGASVSIVGTPTQLAVDGLVVPNGKLKLDVGDKIHVMGDKVDLSGLTIEFSTTPAANTAYEIFTFNGNILTNAAVRKAIYFVPNQTVSGNHATFALSYDESTDKTTTSVTYKPSASALSDETVWNGPVWNAGGWSDGLPTAEKVASFSSAEAPTSVTVPADGSGEAGAVSVSSGADYVFTGDEFEISGDQSASWFDIASGSATFDLPIWMRYSLPVTLAAGTSATFNETITGGGIVKTGKGALTLAADNSFRDAVSVGGGLNIVASAGALDNQAKSATLTDDTLVFTNAVDDAEMVVSTPVILNSATSKTNAVIVKADSDVRLKDLTVSNGALVKRGKGRLTIEASDTKNMTLYSGLGPTTSGNKYRVVTSTLVDFAADGTAPAPSAKQYAGFNVAEGEVVIKGNTNVTRQVKIKTGCCIGMNTAGDAATAVQPELTIDGADVDAYSADTAHFSIGVNMCGIAGCAVARPTLRILNGGICTAVKYHFGTSTNGAKALPSHAFPTLAITNSEIYAENGFDFDLTAASPDSTSLIRAKDSTIGITGTGGSHHGFVMYGSIDADFDHCFVGGTTQISKFVYYGDGAGTLRLRNGSVLAAIPNNNHAKGDYAVTFVFDNSEWRWGGGDATLRYANTTGDWILFKPNSAASTNRRDIRMEGVGVILKPNAGCTFTTEVPFKGTGGLVSAGEGTVKFTSNTLQFTGLVDIRSGTVDLSTANALDALSVRGPGTLKGGTITTLTISETLDNGNVVGAPVLDGVTAERVFVDFGRDETSPIGEFEAENLLVATYSTENPPTVGKWKVAGTGFAHPHAEFTVSGGEVRATVKDVVGTMMIFR